MVLRTHLPIERDEDARSELVTLALGRVDEIPLYGRLWRAFSHAFDEFGRHFYVEPAGEAVEDTQVVIEARILLVGARPLAFDSDQLAKRRAIRKRGRRGLARPCERTIVAGEEQGR